MSELTSDGASIHPSFRNRQFGSRKRLSDEHSHVALQKGVFCGFFGLSEVVSVSRSMEFRLHFPTKPVSDNCGTHLESPKRPWGISYSSPKAVRKALGGGKWRFADFFGLSESPSHDCRVDCRHHFSINLI